MKNSSSVPRPFAVASSRSPPLSECAANTWPAEKACKETDAGSLHLTLGSVNLSTYISVTMSSEIPGCAKIHDFVGKELDFFCDFFLGLKSKLVVRPPVDLEII